ncbi:MAG: nuclease A inhibitor family protein [Saprospiraceae bacterium]|nr:hypothetical protein [Lewinella sp.]
MSRISKNSVHAALERAADIILSATTGDPFISRRDIRNKLEELQGEEKALVGHFYRFVDARDAKKGARVTKKDVEAALLYTKEKVLDKYDLNNNGFSKAEIDNMSTLGKLTVAFATHLKRVALAIESKTPEDIAQKLTELTDGVFFTGFGSEGDEPVEVIHLQTDLDYLDAQALADALGYDTSTPEGTIEKQYTYSPELNFELIDSIYFTDDDYGIRTNEVVRYMTAYLTDLIVVIFGEDLVAPPQHPWYWAGIAKDGSIIGLQSQVIWT